MLNPTITILEVSVTPCGSYTVHINIKFHNHQHGEKKTYLLEDRSFFNGTDNPTTRCPADVQRAIETAVFAAYEAGTLKIFQTDLGGERREIAIEDFDADDVVLLVTPADSHPK